ncbi:UdgX family uracil-DNA binding protein [Acidimangrovimonas sediminis]|uniref:UdgX family uracil-DNA binding protein n=1 Tax=Acidimangrovimonas sediminis TaxID=2056283 RepID=UPI000C80BF37|nr:UdgX family uracil-DNA binding protein [Acidimangrovimonas sediminis]
MERVVLPRIGTVAAWRDAARGLAGRGVPADAVLWQVGAEAPDLFAGAPAPAATGEPRAVRLPRVAVASLEAALCHSDPERFARAYALLLRLAAGDLRWGDRSDPALRRLLQQEKAVRRDIHKMHAFVRFREVTEPGAERRAFAAWYEPDHPVVEAAAPFFARRFGDMDWVIATPVLTARFTAGGLRIEETGDTRPPPEDATEELWRTYFANIFNPARLMPRAMRSEMPKKFWQHLPEARLIPGLIREAPARALAMQEAAPTFAPARAARIVPSRPALPDLTLETLKPALDACRRCPLGACATQGIAGEGSAGGLMVVGEQPGDAEDLAGRPFVGPAGQMFDTCAREAGLDRAAAYVTNAVKHFKFAPRGKRRLHRRPDGGEVQACRWWLEFERRAVAPRLTLAMGATAALALTGRGEGILARRGRVETARDGGPVLITLHPAHLLRQPDPARRAEAREAFATDLRAVVAMLGD